MWYKINVYNKPHNDGLTTVIRIICDIDNTYYMWYKINVYNKPHTDGLTTVIRIICDIRLMFIIKINTLTDWQRLWYKINVYNKPHTDDVNGNTYYMCLYKPHTDGLTTVIRTICDIRLMFIINHTLTDWQR